MTYFKFLLRACTPFTEFETQLRNVFPWTTLTLPRISWLQCLPTKSRKSYGAATKPCVHLSTLRTSRLFLALRFRFSLFFLRRLLLNTVFSYASTYFSCVALAGFRLRLHYRPAVTRYARPSSACRVFVRCVFILHFPTQEISFPPFLSF